MRYLRERGFWYGLLALALMQLVLQMILGNDILAHSPYDSYTLQAMTWRSGRIALPQDYPWLELAVFRGYYYVSFPPLPAVPMLILSLLFGGETPSALVAMSYFLAAYAFAYAICRRRMGAQTAAFSALFVCAGCNLLEVCLYGGVWNMAQALAFLLTMVAAWGVSSGERRHAGVGLAALALAVGCRPFQACYVPVALWFVYLSCGKSVRRLLPLLVVPALIALVYAGYNHIRFGNPLEFGHNYLPEFAEQSEHGQFSLAYMGENWLRILRLPWWDHGRHRLLFPSAYGFLFFLCNPLFLVALIGALRREWDVADALIAICALLHFALLLTHKSFGGWQFGTRYLCDLIPMLALFWARRARGLRGWEPPLMLLAIAFNFYGTLAQHLFQA